MRQREQHREMEPMLTQHEVGLTLGIAPELVFDLVAEGNLSTPKLLAGNGYRWLARDVPSEPWLVKRVERIAAHRARRGKRQPDWATPADDEAGR